MNNLLQNSLTARSIIPIGDKNTLPTMTEPDQTLSIKQLVERHVNGIQTGVREYEPLYTDIELPNIEFMDIEELYQYREMINQQKFMLEDKLRENRKKEQEFIAEQRQQLRMQAQSPTPPTKEVRDEHHRQPSPPSHPL